MTRNSSSSTNRVTLRQIAQHANVSVSTVSRALSDNPNVNAATRELVYQTVEELNYPLENLRGANHTQAQSVLMLARGDFAQETSEFSFGADFEKLVTRGALDALEAVGFEVNLKYMQMTAAEAESFVDSFEANGVILLTGMVAPEFVLALKDANIPFIIAGAHVFPIGTNYVMADNVRGVEQAVNHLVERGRRVIGLVNSSTLTNTSEDKLRGLRLGLHRHNLPFSEAQVVSSLDFNLESGYRQTLHLLDQIDDLDSIIYGHDVMAMGGLRALKERGLTVPRDIAVIGYHDYDIAQFTNPALTTVRFDTELMGNMAARRLKMMIEEPDGQEWCLSLPTSLIIRDST